MEGHQAHRQERRQVTVYFPVITPGNEVMRPAEVQVQGTPLEKLTSSH